MTYWQRCKPTSNVTRQQQRKETTMSKTAITAEPGIPQIVITREFDAARDLVFRAHIDPDLLVQWLGPRDLAMTIDKYAARGGGIWRYVDTDADRDAMIASGMEHGVQDSRERLTELLIRLRTN
jgi:hypothetical protein